MTGRLIAFVLLGAAASFGYCALLSTAYPFVIASPEARAAIEVSEAHSKELAAAHFASDLIGFSIFGGLLCSLVALLCSHAAGLKHRVLSVLVGCVFGAIGGFGMGQLGYAFHGSMISILPDPLVHTFSRLSVMFLPVAIAVGLTAAFAHYSKAVATNAVVGAIMGGLLAALLYSVLVGSVTPMEITSAILPVHSQNRYLLFMSAFLAIGIVMLLQVAKTPFVRNQIAKNQSSKGQVAVVPQPVAAGAEGTSE